MQQAIARQTSFSARMALEMYFIHDNTGDGNREMQRMNHVNNHYRKCVMTLRSSDSERGSAAWFTRLWISMQSDDQDAFELNVEQKYLFRQGDFHVSRGTHSECPVIFYLYSVLNPLVLRTFSTHATVIHESALGILRSPQSRWTQAHHVLHNPSLGHNEYRSFLDEAYDAPENRGNPLLRMSLTATTNPTLSSLLTQLQALNSIILRPQGPGVSSVELNNNKFCI